MISKVLLAEVRSGFALRLDGLHGEAHWDRVCENGLFLAERTGADVDVVELFAYLHDAKRLNDGWDKEHGLRAAQYVRRLGGALLMLSDRQLDLLAHACAHHSEGLTEADVTVQTCWDADRLDLGRIDIKPEPRFLCTPAARDPAMIKWAFRKSQQGIRLAL
jgi:uncharacterized protein